jgi:hypothetical protein
VRFAILFLVETISLWRERREIESLIFNRLSFFCEKCVSIYENIAKCSILVYIFTMADEHDGTNEDRKPWDQMEGESSLWYGRFRVYLELGFKRSVNAVFREEMGLNEREEAHGRWHEEAKRYQWQERAKVYDDFQREEEDKLIAQEREKVLRSGYALMHNRIKLLNKFVEKMEQWADDDDKAWIIKTQDITGEGFHKHTEEETFNAPMFAMMDKYLDSIAKETGERVKKKEVAITELPPNVYLGFDPDEDGTTVVEKEEKDENA